jgi:hypothetical protein
MKDKELKLEETEAARTRGGAVRGAPHSSDLHKRVCMLC